jgi:hypothetical protein
MGGVVIGRVYHGRYRRRSDGRGQAALVGPRPFGARGYVR